jgi:hypothetical protein
MPVPSERGHADCAGKTCHPFGEIELDRDCWQSGAPIKHTLAAGIVTRQADHEPTGGG